MLMQIMAWIIGVPCFVLALAYAAIFSALLLARFRQHHAGFPPHSSGAAIRDLRGVPPGAMSSQLH